MTKTLQQIADIAEVSVSTASRALNGHAAISPATVARVRQAAEQLRYRPRRSHRRMDASRCLAKATIGILSLGMDRSLAALPVVASSMLGAEAALSDAGATVQLAHVPDLENPPSGLLRTPFDGLVLSGALQGQLVSRAEGSLLRRLRVVPTVWLLGRPSGCWGDSIASDDFQTGSAAAEYLVARGHRRLAFVNPKPDHVLFMRREDGFAATARRLGAEVRSYCELAPGKWDLPLHPPESVEAVDELVDRLIAARPRPTAVFTAADSVAALVYRALAVRGLCVGQDISVVSGNNDAALIQSLFPRLTTFDVHAQELGRLAVRQLATRISFPGEHPDVELTLPATLSEGDSVREVA